MDAATTSRARKERLDKASEVTITGPITLVELIIAESKAYAVRRNESGTRSFQSGRTDKLMGGAVMPRINAVIRIDREVSIEFSVRIRAE
jgi:hypothetical protein